MHSKYLSFYPQISVVLTIYQRHSVLQQMETFTETSQTEENKSLQSAQPQLVHLYITQLLHLRFREHHGKWVENGKSQGTRK